MSRVALVTGGSRGIGRAIAIDLARAGHSVAINYRARAEDAKETLAQVHAHAEGIVVQADVSDSDQIVSMFSTVEEQLGAPEILVNCAGVRKDGLALRMSDDEWHDVMETNLYGPFACTRRALPAMLKARWGRIVNVSSVAGLRGIAGQANYCAAKAGLLGLTRALAVEVARKGITVNAIAPGLVTTELTTSLGEDRFGQLERAIPMQRAGDPAEISGLVAFLCSGDAGYVSGAVFVADGAMTA